jgi:hypothetical protein
MLKINKVKIFNHIGLFHTDSFRPAWNQNILLCFLLNPSTHPSGSDDADAGDDVDAGDDDTDAGDDDTDVGDDTAVSTAIVLSVLMVGNREGGIIFRAGLTLSLLEAPRCGAGESIKNSS